MVKLSVESRFAKVTSFNQLRVNSWQEGLYQRGILRLRTPRNIKYAIKQSLTVCMTRLGEGNFRQTYEGAVHTYNTYISTYAHRYNMHKTYKGPCHPQYTTVLVSLRPSADTRLGTQNLCEGPKHTKHTLHKDQCLKTTRNLKAQTVHTSCWCALCTLPSRTQECWCPPGEG